MKELLLQQHRLQLTCSEDVSDFTWSNCRYHSYLDYFLSRDLRTTNFRLHPTRLGSSDHQPISVTITDAKALVVERRTKLNRALAHRLVPDMREAFKEFVHD